MAVLVGRGASCGLWQGMVLCTLGCSKGGPGQLAQWAGEITCPDWDHPMLYTELAGGLIPLLGSRHGRPGQCRRSLCRCQSHGTLFKQTSCHSPCAAPPLGGRGGFASE